MDKTNNVEYLVGMDCNIKKTGVAIYKPATNNLQLYSGTLADAVVWLNSSKVLGRCIAVVEDPNLDSPLFGARKAVFSIIKRMQAGKLKESEALGQFSILLKRAQHVGKSQGAAETFLQFFETAGVPSVRIAPSRRTRADRPQRAGGKVLPVGLLTMPTKTTAYQFKQLTGYSERCNEHARDAAMLVWGKSIAWAISELQMQKVKVQ